MKINGIVSNSQKRHHFQYQEILENKECSEVEKIFKNNI